ncbi:type II secretion system minor pseudopilin GspJ [Enterobacter ludwigii]|uniref:type II secretion system minor pseudopilin GspJ n=1 Tax=Enterobacter ludwigii TaxID=299767 RepID=UPI001E3DAA8A|nr:type II secretion system minor pseudopilin GspJ [Enterobacter ludwigii]MCE1613398.1 type II secretion system minor pseudopilin GspJ [Enterobacter ludwigii]MCE1626699.1 type II secretion system minor pseudopilin GspJ [Enterobacter ludwigii]
MATAMRRLRREQGFTLLEMLIAITIFAALSVMMAQISRTVLFSQGRIMTKSEDIASIQLGLTIIERDISQALVRRAIDKAHPNMADFRSGKHHFDTLELVRRNRINPGSVLARSSIERVMYRVTEGKLQRISSADGDTQFAHGHAIALLQGVSQFKLRFWYQGKWQDGWFAGSVLPAAIEVSLDLTGYGHLRRVIPTGATTS